MPPARIALAAIIQRQFNASEPAALVAVVVIIADIDPLRSVRGPNPAPAIVVASVEVVSAANESEAIEAIMMVMEEGWVMCERCAREGRRKCGTRHWHGGETSRADLWSYAHWVPNHAHGVRPRHATHAVAGADPRRGTNAMSAAHPHPAASTAHPDPTASAAHPHPAASAAHSHSTASTAHSAGSASTTSTVTAAASTGHCQGR